MTDLTNHKKILCLDFDGVCHSYVSGWKGADVIPDPPVDGMWNFLNQAVYPFEVHIFSSRSHQEGGLQAMRDWFKQWARTEEDLATIGQLQFPEEKPPAFVGIDDRVVTFTGSWPDINALTNFKTWNAKSL